MDNLSKEYFSREIEVWIYGRKIKGKRKQIIEDEIKKIFWITYRSEFPELDSDKRLKSDKGWGCMLRCGQMMLANVFAMLNETSGTLSIESKNKILEKFQDIPSATFSIHSIVNIGKTQRVEVGKWFGPNIICHVLSKILNGSNLGLKMHVVVDFVVNVEEISNMMTKEPLYNNSDCHPLLIIVPYSSGKRGNDDILFNYINTMFEQPTFAGMLGGVSTHALYFYGKFEKSLLFLDPHTTRKSQIDINEFRNSCVFSKINLKKINNVGLSFALSFLFKTKASFNDWCKVIKETAKDFVSICDNKPGGPNISNIGVTRSNGSAKMPQFDSGDYDIL